MAKAALRVTFDKAPPSVLKQLFGEAKHSAHILAALQHFDGQAHAKEIFHYVNTDENGKFVQVQGSNGEMTVPVTMANLAKQLSTMVAVAQIKRLGERSSRFALMDYEGEAPEGEDDGDEGDEQSAE